MSKWRSNSILFSWIRSYALVLFIPIVMMGIIYVQTQRVIEEEINRANSSLLEQVREEIDAQLEHVQRLREVISFNTRVRSLLYAQPKLSPDDRLTIVKTIDDFRAYSSTNRYIDSFYLYYQNGDFILTDRAHYTPEMYYDLHLAATGLDYEKWRELLTKRHGGSFINGQDYGIAGGRGDIWFAQSLPIENPSGALATLIIHMNKDRLQAALQNMRSYQEEGSVYIIDGKGRVLASSAAESPPEALPSIEEMTKEYGVLPKVIDEEDYIVSYIRSSMMNWTLVYTLPARVYREKAEYVRNLTVLTLLLAVALGAAASVYAAWRNYHPIRRLVKTLSSNPKLKPWEAANELHFIGESLEQTLMQNDAMNRIIEKQNHILRSNLIVRLLKGRIESDFPLKEALGEYRIRLKSDQFAVILFYIEDFSGLFRKEEQDAEKNLRFVHLIVTNIVEELVSRRHQGWVAEVDEMLACLVCLAPGTKPETAKEELLQLLEEARGFIGHRFHIEFTGSLSSVHQTVSGIPSAYREAVEAMEYRMLLGTGTTIDYERIREKNVSYVYPLEMEHKLINYVKSGSYEMAKAILDEVFETNLRMNAISVDMARCLVFDMISTMMKASMEAASGQAELYEDNQRAIHAILQEKTVDQIREQMAVFLQRVCDYVNSRKKSRNVRLKEELLAYIEENYRDPNLAVVNMSDQFEIHPSYLSRFFKEQTGDTVSDYINRFRMNQAKRLLLEEQASIKNVSEEVGIYSISTFIRLFKKYEGITPGAYRELHRTRSTADA
jgi:AraC-like DNA-binding protein